MANERTRQLLRSCDPAQIAAVTSSAAPLLVLAGAGSGKTRVLTTRIAWQVLEEVVGPSHVLAVTFTRKAAAELRDRLGSLGLPAPVLAGTFHALALRELRRYAADAGRQPPQLLESKARLLGSVIDAAQVEKRLSRRNALSAVATEIEWAKARLVPPASYAETAERAFRRPLVAFELVTKCYARYEEEKRRRRVLDFDDLLTELAQLIENDIDFAAVERWRFQTIFVDEFQDVNSAQLRLLDAWLGGRRSLTAVGDPCQAIYAWNGADSSAITSFEHRFPGASVLRLETNYRSTPQVVRFAASALRRSDVVVAEAVRPDGPVPTLLAYSDEEAEAQAVASAIRTKRGTRTWKDVAVLARTNAQLKLFASTFDDVGIPWQSGGASSFLGLPTIRASLAQLPSSKDQIAFYSWLESLEARAAPHHDESEECPPEDSPELAALVRLAREYADLDPLAGSAGFLPYLRELLRDESFPIERQAVDLLSFHRAKGLEWKVVYVTGLEQGYVPHARALEPAAIEEERRLLYVALSRATDEVHCSFARTRTFGSRRIAREPSPYLGPIDAARAALVRAATPSAQQSRRLLAEARASLDADAG